VSSGKGPRRSGKDGTARVIAARLLDDVLSSGVPADLPLERAGRRLDERDRRFLAELLYGALRWLRRLDHVIAIAASRSTEAIDPRLLSILRIGAVQLLALDRVPSHAAVSEAVDEARRIAGRGASGFVNAVLRRISERPDFDAWPLAGRDPVSRLALEASHPEPLVRRWWERYGEAATRAIVASNNGPRSLHLLALGDPSGREGLARRLDEEGVATRPSDVAPQGLVVVSGAPLAGAAFAQGAFYVQDVASQAAALVPAPAAGERILDAAAAPGGKGFAILATEPGASLVFADVDLRRLPRLRANLRRLGVEAPLAAADASRPPFAPCFDRVLLDAPCSGTGTLRRHPELRWRFEVDGLGRLAGRTEGRLERLAETVAPGGRLVVATCSIEAEENEDVVKRLVARRRDLVVEPLAVEANDATGVRPTSVGGWRLLPIAGHDGFTVHSMIRN